MDGKYGAEGELSGVCSYWEDGIELSFNSEGVGSNGRWNLRPNNNGDARALPGDSLRGREELEASGDDVSARKGAFNSASDLVLFNDLLLYGVRSGTEVRLST